jgi:hypothetical protein
MTGRSWCFWLSGDRRGFPPRAGLSASGGAGICGAVRELPGNLLRDERGMRGYQCGKQNGGDHDVVMLVNRALDGIKDSDISCSANFPPAGWVKRFP